MSAPLPKALRARFHRYIEEGFSVRAGGGVTPEALACGRRAVGAGDPNAGTWGSSASRSPERPGQAGPLPGLFRGACRPRP